MDKKNNLTTACSERKARILKEKQRKEENIQICLNCSKPKCSGRCEKIKRR